jgi:hypothetical protein
MSIPLKGYIMEFDTLEMHNDMLDLQYQSKVWTHRINPGFSYIFYYFLHCRIIVKTSKL